MAQRDAKGRFVKGHKSTGHRPTRKAEEDMLARFKAAITPADLDVITDVLVKQAKKGNRAAVKIIFSYLFGLPRQMVEVQADIRTNILYADALAQVYGEK